MELKDLRLGAPGSTAEKVLGSVPLMRALAAGEPGAVLQSDEYFEFCDAAGQKAAAEMALKVLSERIAEKPECSDAEATVILLDVYDTEFLGRVVLSRKESQPTPTGLEPTMPGTKSASQEPLDDLLS